MCSGSESMGTLFVTYESASTGSLAHKWNKRRFRISKTIKYSLLNALHSKFNGSTKNCY